MVGIAAHHERADGEAAVPNGHDAADGRGVAVSPGRCAHVAQVILVGVDLAHHRSIVAWH